MSFKKIVREQVLQELTGMHDLMQQRFKKKPTPYGKPTITRGTMSNNVRDLMWRKGVVSYADEEQEDLTPQLSSGKVRVSKNKLQEMISNTISKLLSD